MTAIDSSAAPTYETAPSVLMRDVDGEMVLLDLGTEQYFGLNQVGADMVQRLTTLPEKQARAALLADYTVAPEVLLADLDALVAQLLDAGLLRRRSAA